MLQHTARCSKHCAHVILQAPTSCKSTCAKPVFIVKITARTRAIPSVAGAPVQVGNGDGFVSDTNPVRPMDTPQHVSK